MTHPVRRTLLVVALAALTWGCGGESDRQAGSDAHADVHEQAAPDIDATDVAGDDAVPTGDATDDPGPAPDDVVELPHCTTGVPCAGEFDCEQGERCNLTLTPPTCQTLYCAGAGEPCDPATGDKLCAPGLFCVPLDPPRCATCKPDCAYKACGDDGCGGSCGDCALTEECSPARACVPRLPWIALPAGTYPMGSDHGDSFELPIHDVTLSAFEISKTEATQGEYQACVDAGICTPSWCDADPLTGDDFPVVCVDWPQARRFCDWVGARLCTEAEWEYAARSGGKVQEYPWGDAEPSCELAVMNDGVTGEACGTGGAWAACSKPAGNTAQGVCDLAGNVWEWTADWFGPYPNGPQTDPTGPASGDGPVVRGGCWYFPAPSSLRSSMRAGYDPEGAGRNMGLRCCR